MSIINQAASFAKAIAVQVAAGCPMADKEQQKERHDVCQSCDKFNVKEYRCGVCSCFLHLKIPLLTSICPLGRWPDLNKEKSNE